MDDKNTNRDIFEDREVNRFLNDEVVLLWNVQMNSREHLKISAQYMHRA